MADPVQVSEGVPPQEFFEELLQQPQRGAVAPQDGTQNGQQLFMQGRIRVEGDMAFLMQVASLTL